MRLTKTGQQIRQQKMLLYVTICNGEFLADVTFSNNEKKVESKNLQYSNRVANFTSSVLSSPSVFFSPKGFFGLFPIYQQFLLLYGYFEAPGWRFL